MDGTATTTRVDKNSVFLKRATKQNDCYVDATPQERIAIIWELTEELWSLKDKQHAECRLQRNVTNLIRQRS